MSIKNMTPINIYISELCAILWRVLEKWCFFEYLPAFYFLGTIFTRRNPAFSLRCRCILLLLARAFAPVHFCWCRSHSAKQNNLHIMRLDNVPYISPALNSMITDYYNHRCHCKQLQPYSLRAAGCFLLPHILCRHWLNSVSDRFS